MYKNCLYRLTALVELGSNFSCEMNELLTICQHDFNKLLQRLILGIRESNYTSVK